MNKIETLKQSLEIVAGDADSQLSYLNQIGHIDKNSDELLSYHADEIVLQLIDDKDYIIQYLQNAGLASKKFFDNYSELKILCGIFINRPNDEFWTVKSLISDSRWEEIRKIAKICVDEMPKYIVGDHSPLAT